MPWSAAERNGHKHEECTVCGYAKAAVEIPATGTDTSSGSNQSGDTSSPQTDDYRNIMLSTVLLMISGIGLAATVVFHRKRRCKIK